MFLKSKGMGCRYWLKPEGDRAVNKLKWIVKVITPASGGPYEFRANEVLLLILLNDKDSMNMKKRITHNKSVVVLRGEGKETIIEPPGRGSSEANYFR